MQLLSSSGASSSSGSNSRRRTALIALLLTLALSGCAVSGRATKPPRPTLESLSVRSDGGICMSRQDAQELLLYIDALERR